MTKDERKAEWDRVYTAWQAATPNSPEDYELEDRLFAMRKEGAAHE